MTTLVLGANGQVGRHLGHLMPHALLWQRQDADLTDPHAVEQAIVALAPRVVINAAAYTAVDRAESDPRTAWLVNAESVAAMARACAAAGAALIHISTDYVFDGQSTTPYGPDSPTSPLGVYGRTKLAGELAARTLCERSWVIRTSWVFSEYGGNFVKTMLRLASERDSLRVVNDQRGRPSDACDVAYVAQALQDQVLEDRAPAPGLYHAGGGPVVSWCEFAGTIFERATALGLLERPPAVAPITTSEYPTPARRPMNAVLEPSRAFQEALAVSPDWRRGLDRALGQLKGVSPA